MSISSYKSIREAVVKASNSGRGSGGGSSLPEDTSSSGRVVEGRNTNPRDLMDEITTRFFGSSAGGAGVCDHRDAAVYQEWISHSDDAGATVAELHFTTSTTNRNNDEEEVAVAEVLYRHNGRPIRREEWDRLQKIDQVNPTDGDGFGTIAAAYYAMFSICSEPAITSGSKAMVFTWKGDDSLETHIADYVKQLDDDDWTSFLLPLRHPQPVVQDFVSLGRCLCRGLTFTETLQEIRVYVNQVRQLSIGKKLLDGPKPFPQLLQEQEGRNDTPLDGLVKDSPKGLCSLQDAKTVTYRIRVEMEDEQRTEEAAASVDAHYVMGTVETRLSAVQGRHIQRATKKKTPSTVTVQILQTEVPTLLLSEHKTTVEGNKNNRSMKIASSFTSSQVGEGRIYVRGCKTSQTTGFAVHCSAPFVTTTAFQHRDGIDLQRHHHHPVVSSFNAELLRMCGVLLRLLLEQRVSDIGRRRSDDDSSKEDDDDSEITAKDGDITAQEDRDAIRVLQLCCPRRSTPESAAGETMQEGFLDCLPHRGPPVLTAAGVVIAGNVAKLPNSGLEDFVDRNVHVVRKAIYQHTMEYHDSVVKCPRLTLKDLEASMESTVFRSVRHLAAFFQWYAETGWNSFPSMKYIHEQLKFNFSKDPMSISQHVKDFPYYVDNTTVGGSAAAATTLPLPETVLPRRLQEATGLDVLQHAAFQHWFQPLSAEDWVDFLCRHPCMIAAGKTKEDADLRVQVLLELNRCFHVRSGSHERMKFQERCRERLEGAACIPVHSPLPGDPVTALPSSLLLPSAKRSSSSDCCMVDESLLKAGVSEEFLSGLGVQSSSLVINSSLLGAIHDDKKWKGNPKGMIEYIQSLQLPYSEIKVLRLHKYLPVEHDDTRLYAPHEVYLPNAKLRQAFGPVVPLLAWPHDEVLDPDTGTGDFLARQLGLRVHPPAEALLQYVVEHVTDDDEQNRIKCLDYLSANLAVRDGAYTHRFRNSPALRRMKFLPCVVLSCPLEGGGLVVERTLECPESCYGNRACAALGFPILDPALGGARAERYATRFQCTKDPHPGSTLRALLKFAKKAKKLLPAANSPTAVGGGKEQQKILSDRIVKTFRDTFEYLSGRMHDFESCHLSLVSGKPIIPCMVEDCHVEWRDPSQVIFHDEELSSRDPIVDALFDKVEYSLFLRRVGVREEVTTDDLFRAVLQDPERALEKLGSDAMYQSLLCRFASSYPSLLSFEQFRASELRNTAFLLAYKTANEKSSGTEESGSERNEQRTTTTYRLAAGPEICIVDNSSYAGMFTALRAPRDSNLEDFYEAMGATCMSKAVRASYEIEAGGGGSSRRHTLASASAAAALRELISERVALLVSPEMNSNSNRRLVRDAASLLHEDSLDVLEAAGTISATYLWKSERAVRQTTCCCKSDGDGSRRALYVTSSFEWFDVGRVISELIFKRCRLEDTIVVAALLETPLDTLRCRGFPVDRVLMHKPAQKKKQQIIARAEIGTAESEEEEENPFATAEAVATAAAHVGEQLGGVGMQLGSTFLGAAASVSSTSSSWFGSSVAALTSTVERTIASSDALPEPLLPSPGEREAARGTTVPKAGRMSDKDLDELLSS